ncbi:hypothetical protein GA0115233_107634 [Streptomyces sp. DI166]|uniref:hypothetical protein n=1 Tax=Streptomyces sp. DI166 TaxID=1839783 RepID=UPI0007F3A9BC|nr:hypothetical protein [Streptomyces sp. DI166]SBT94000.1 hypothetical protein GA0115233_107634 [Streptomyces sp. DI166]
MELPDRAAPGVETLASEAADAACALADAAGPTAWNLAAAEDAAEAIDTLAQALAAIDPEAARLLAVVPAATKALLRHLGQDQGDGVAEQTVAAVPSPRAPKPRRRGLGPGWQGVREPSAER